MTNEQKINAFFSDFNKRFDGNIPESVPRIIAETATEYYRQALIQKKWDGVPYKKYQGKKEPTKGSLMMRSNNLFRSIKPLYVAPERVTIGAGSSKVRYARIHNEGGRVRGVRNVRPFHNNNFMGKGKRVQIKGHTRKVDYIMPKRQFIGFASELNKQIITRLKQSFKTK